MKILNATYGGKDVTSILQSKVNGEVLNIAASNAIAGDPKPGVYKKLIVEYEVNGQKFTAEAGEGSVLSIPFTGTNKLGIFYTNNRIDLHVIKNSISTIQTAARKHEVDIITSVWEHIPDNPFHEVVCNVKTGNHFNIAYQICSLLETARLNMSKRYDTVSFLEHDVLYGEDYFNYEPFEGNVICNHNFIGLCKEGFQPKGQGDEPLHQLTMKFDFAVEHFKNVLFRSIVAQALLEPTHDPVYTRRQSVQPSIHVNHGRHFTSHFNIYTKKYFAEHPYWGNYEVLYSELLRP